MRSTPSTIIAITVTIIALQTIQTLGGSSESSYLDARSFDDNDVDLTARFDWRVWESKDKKDTRAAMKQAGERAKLESEARQKQDRLARLQGASTPAQRREYVEYNFEARAEAPVSVPPAPDSKKEARDYHDDFEVLSARDLEQYGLESRNWLFKTKEEKDTKAAEKDAKRKAKAKSEAQQAADRLARVTGGSTAPAAAPPTAPVERREYTDYDQLFARDHSEYDLESREYLDDELEARELDDVEEIIARHYDDDLEDLD
ncbi:hypothetical protein C8J56DRAFT_898689 [Mycena floridula]|nr:hypothetical protein C8J56DRAFT_898689 [Mycena floridula]